MLFFHHIHGEDSSTTKHGPTTRQNLGTKKTFPSTTTSPQPQPFSLITSFSHHNAPNLSKQSKSKKEKYLHSKNGLAANRTPDLSHIESAPVKAGILMLREHYTTKPQALYIADA
jgi:hypothetical protein